MQSQEIRINVVHTETDTTVFRDKFEHIGEVTEEDLQAYFKTTRLAALNELGVPMTKHYKCVIKFKKTTNYGGN